MAEFAVPSKKRNAIVATVLITSSLLVSILVSKAGVAAGILLIVGTLALLALLVVFNSYKDGFLLMVVYSFFMFALYRILPPSLPYFPMGVLIEIFLALLAFTVLIHGMKGDNRLDARLYRNPIAYALLIYVGYALLLMFHPASSGIMGRVVAMREIISFVLSFYIIIHVFQTFSYVKFFTDFWIALALLAALYGIYQEVFGLRAWEWRWLNSNPEGAKLAIIWGHVRKWSFLSDINAFGLFMSYGAIVCLVLTLGPFAWRKKIYFAACGILMLVSMTFSGTRTAMAMVPFGLLFFVMMNLNNSTTIFFAALFTFLLLAVLFGPFYGGTFSRIRSTFKISDDASMSVRYETRSKVQPYIWSHPLGGGINTSGHLGLKNEPDHALAGSWDPDSGYLKTALERGWIGLLVQLGLFATILIYGLLVYYNSSDPLVRVLCCAYLCGFFALSIANFTQDSMDQKPVSLILMASYASLIKMSTLTKNTDG